MPLRYDISDKQKQQLCTVHIYIGGHNVDERGIRNNLTEWLRAQTKRCS